MMTLKQMQTFYWVCKAGSFAAAADRLHSTQTTVSMRIRDLEANLGIELFDRSHRTAQLTSKGKEMFQYAEKMLLLVSEIEDVISNPESLSGNVRLGASDFIAITWLPNLVSAIHELFPRAVIDLDIDMGPNVLKKLESGYIEIALIPALNKQAGFTYVELGKVSFAWMASPQLCIPAEISPKDLRSWPLLSLPRESNSFQIVNTWLDENNALIRRTHICNSIQVIMSLTIAGIGVSHLPVQYLMPEIEGKKLSIIRILPEISPLFYYAVFSKHRTSALAKRIASVAQKHSLFFRPEFKSKSVPIMPSAVLVRD